MTFDDACGLIATMMNERFSVDRAAGEFTTRSVAAEILGEVEPGDDRSPRSTRYPREAMTVLVRSGNVDDAAERIHALMTATVARLAELQEPDRAEGWTVDLADGWAETLRDTQAKLRAGPPDPRSLWLVTGLARQLDHDGLFFDTELSQRLLTISTLVSMLPDGQAPTPSSDTGSPVPDDRLRFTTRQAAVLRHVLSDEPTAVRAIAERATRNEVLSDEDAETLVGALTTEMLRHTTPDGDISARGSEIDDLLGIANQLAESFYD